MNLNKRLRIPTDRPGPILRVLNRLPNPGEKRLLQAALERCAKVPRGMVDQVEGVLRAVSSADQGLVARIEELVDGLDQLLLEQGFDPETSLPLAQ